MEVLVAHLCRYPCVYYDHIVDSMTAARLVRVTTEDYEMVRGDGEMRET